LGLLFIVVPAHVGEKYRWVEPRRYAGTAPTILSKIQVVGSLVLEGIGGGFVV